MCLTSLLAFLRMIYLSINTPISGVRTAKGER
jgi:hypothetical protein